MKQIGRGASISRDCDIRCRQLIVGNEVVIEEKTRIHLYGTLRLGDLCTLGRRTVIRGNNVSIGSEFFSTGNLEIGGGGWRNPQANLLVGDKCVMHNNQININRPVTIGNHVGLSPEVALITHGYWLSPLRGNPFREEPIVIDDNVIIGWRSIVLAGVHIGQNSVVGAGAVVTRDVEPFTVVSGVPAKPISKIDERSVPKEARTSMASEFIEEYKESLEFRGIMGVTVLLDYPLVRINEAVFNLETEEADIPANDDIVDDFRDFIRRKGIWFYGRRFESVEGLFP